MFKCTDCGKVFHEPEGCSEQLGEFWRDYEGCPYCGSEYYEDYDEDDDAEGRDADMYYDTYRERMWSDAV
jgi:predicted  nucleic acid-binding Zn-ribbon protein